jgi:hypothetical protein
VNDIAAGFALCHRLDQVERKLAAQKILQFEFKCLALSLLRALL